MNLKDMKLVFPGQKLICLDNTLSDYLQLGDVFSIDKQVSEEIYSLTFRDHHFDAKITKNSFIHADNANAKPYVFGPEAAEIVALGLDNRRGVAVWPSQDLSALDLSWTTPLLTFKGDLFPSPHWRAPSIGRVIQDKNMVRIEQAQVYKKFHVAVKQRGMFNISVTDGGSRKIREYTAKAIEKHGRAWHEFDYSSFENCLIMIPSKTYTLEEWLKGEQNASH